jgi:hypothetical protein
MRTKQRAVVGAALLAVGLSAGVSTLANVYGQRGPSYSVMSTARAACRQRSPVLVVLGVAAVAVFTVTSFSPAEAATRTYWSGQTAANFTHSSARGLSIVGGDAMNEAYLVAKVATLNGISSQGAPAAHINHMRVANTSQYCLRVRGPSGTAKLVCDVRT